MGHHQLNGKKGAKAFSAWVLLVLGLLTFSLVNGQSIGAFNCALLGLVAFLPSLLKARAKENTVLVAGVLGVTSLLFLVQINSHPETVFAYYGTGLFYLVAFLAGSIALVRHYRYARAVPAALITMGIISSLWAAQNPAQWMQGTLVVLLTYQAVARKLKTKTRHNEKFLPALALGAVVINWGLHAKDWLKLVAQINFSAQFELGSRLESTLMALHLQSPTAQADMVPEALKLGLDLGVVGALAYVGFTAWVAWASLKTQETRKPYALMASSLLVLGLGYPLLSQPWLCSVLGLLLAMGFRPTRKSPKVYVIAVATWTLALSTLTALQPIWFLQSYSRHLEKGAIAESVFLSKPNVERALDNARYATPFKALGALKAEQANKTTDLSQAEEFAKLSIYFYSQAAAIEPRCGMCFEKMADAAKNHIGSVEKAQLKEAYEKALSINPGDTRLAEKIKALNAK